jgi:diguanylate cyclase (GGDEF)-like protein
VNAAAKLTGPFVRLRHLGPARNARLPLAVGLAALLLAGGGAALEVRAVAWLLRADAEATAHAWAVDLDETLGDELPALLARGPPSPETRGALRQARQVSNVFRYKLFDSRGDLVFLSDDLGQQDGIESSLVAHRGSSAVAARILGGGTHVELVHGQPPHRSAYYAEAYVPVHRGGAILGVAEVYVDQTKKQALYRRAFLATGAGLAGLVLLAGLPPALIAWRRTLEHRAAEERAHFLATHDPLTGLPNRRRLGERLQETLARTGRGAGPAALLLVDLDRFKPVNDLHGHLTGDRLLQEVAGRLRTAARETDAVARLGGDEFAVVAELGGGGPEDSARLARRLVAALEAPFELGGITAQVGCSVGIALAPQDAANPEALMRLADLALYRAKAEGRGCFRFFKAGMDARVRERAELETELRLAVARDELEPHFQPLVEISTGRLVGFEMLARWTHPIRGDLPPAEFVPIAEDTGLIAPMTERLLRKACRAAAAWPDDLTVAVNISPLQLRDRGLSAMVRSALEGAGLPARRLEIELTESALIGNLELAREIMDELKALGVRLALDDFGTGYSSLAHLQALPFDKLKIDASFVHAMAHSLDSRKIVAAVVGLGLSLGLPTVAEGVEAPEQAEALARLGCDIGQGWLFGKPISAEAVAALLMAGGGPERWIGELATGA